MARAQLTINQVKEARRRVWNGAKISEVAAKLNVNYNVARYAVIGRSWSSIHQPPPVPSHVIQNNLKPPERTCKNCGQRYQKGATTTHCRRCYEHRQRHGTERNEHTLGQALYARITPEQIRHLHRRYIDGASMADLARELPFSKETLRRRFIALKLPLRSRAGTRQQLTPAIVRHARQLAYEKHIPINAIADHYNIHYQTMYSAITGDTWTNVGGLPIDDTAPRQPCKQCEILTNHPSGLCQFCRS